MLLWEVVLWTHFSNVTWAGMYQIYSSPVKQIASMGDLMLGPFSKTPYVEIGYLMSMT